MVLPAPALGHGGDVDVGPKVCARAIFASRQRSDGADRGSEGEEGLWAQRRANAFIHQHLQDAAGLKNACWHGERCGLLLGPAGFELR